MNQFKTVSHFCKEILSRLRYVLKDKTASLDLRDSVIAEKIDRAAEVVIGNTTYLVSSFFKKNAKSDVVDKVRRLIERDADSVTENGKVTNTTGSSNRLAL